MKIVFKRVFLSLGALMKKISGSEKAEGKIRRYAWLEISGEDIEGSIRKAGLRMRKAAIALALLSAAFLALSFIFSASSVDLNEVLAREAYGRKGRDVSLNVKMSLGEDMLEREIAIRVRPKALDEIAAAALLGECEAWLAREVINFEETDGDIELPRRYPNGPVDIVWRSGDSRRINENGEVKLLNLTEPCYVRITALMSAGDYSKERDFVLKIKRGDLLPSMRRALNDLGKELSFDESGASLILPAEYEGASLEWSAAGGATSLELIPFAMLVLAALYFSRYDALEKRLKARALAIERELPSLALQLVLLLNAGLVLSAALEELLERHAEDDGALYRALRNIKLGAKGGNMSFESELYSFARRSGSRDFIRLASMILDHAGRGSELASKLEKEREILWNSRLSIAKSRAKEAETRLCFPLMLLLLVLVVIAAAPAFMTM